ncbi:MAG: hypothetical protein JXX29_15920 [Deltaproteobacteria bacterium]|nr:hypothetical protein [Deltaproteobacteria bacterium]MBN2673169.1 hypothetical protein [Deltaproteobacteria bacterium]
MIFHWNHFNRISYPALCCGIVFFQACKSEAPSTIEKTNRQSPAPLNAEMPDTEVDSQGPPSPLMAKAPTATAKMNAAPRKPVAPQSPNPPLNTPKHLPAPTTLGEINESAYGNTLWVDNTTVYLATPHSFHVFSQDNAPTHINLEIGYGPAMTPKEIIYWAEGVLYSMPKAGGKSRKRGYTAQQPMQIVASDGQIAWLHKDEQGRYTISRLQGAVPVIVYQSQGAMMGLVDSGKWGFFIESISKSSWRIGRVPLGGRGEPVFSSVFSGRTPSMLSASDSVYFYDLPARSVRRMSLDLKQSSVIAEHIVCSPISASEKIMCARVEGLFELSKTGTPGRILTSEPLGLVTNIAGNARIVAFLNDSGADHMTVRMIPIEKM